MRVYNCTKVPLFDKNYEIYFKSSLFLEFDIHNKPIRYEWFEVLVPLKVRTPKQRIQI